MRKLTLAILALCSATAAYADSNIFSCTTTENLPLSVKKAGNDYVFAYDKLKFNNKIKDALKNEHSEVAVGSGFTTIALELKHKKYSFVVGYIQPRGNSKELIEPGFTIYETKTGRFVDNFPCDSKKKITTNFDIKQMRPGGLAAQ